jgi:succinate dehydrogenase / fumarate reductase iron-sulfur subunit
MTETLMRVFRGDAQGGELVDYRVPVEEGMVVLDVIHYIQAKEAGDMSVRWNCKAGKCGSCSAEVNGKPKLMCMTRMSDYPPGEPITVEPMKAFPLVRDLVTDVSWNYEVNKSIPPFTPAEEAEWKMFQYDVDRVQEFRKCIECFLCQDVCHVLRDHGNFNSFVGPLFLVRLANLDMHPLDTLSRAEFLKDQCGIGFCNITKCCTEVCPESITITDNAIIPLKERVVDEFYDPIRWLIRKIKGP